MIDKGRPSFRVRAALTRLSRDRWLSGEEVGRIARSLAARAAWSQHGISSIVRASCADDCFYVGMIDGKPPAYRFESHYRDVCAVVEKLERNKRLVPEIEFLKIVRKL